MNDLNGLRILVVEDEYIIREMIAEELEGHGALITQSQNGRDAYELFEKEAFDIVISDVRMPKGTGTELMARIHRLRTEPGYQGPNAQTRLYLCSAFGEHSLEEVKAFGVLAIINKPFNWDTMMDTLCNPPESQGSHTG